MNDRPGLIKKCIIAVRLAREGTRDKRIRHFNSRLKRKLRFSTAIQFEALCQDAEHFLRDARIERRRVRCRPEIEHVSHPQGPETRLCAKGVNKYVKARGEGCCPGVVLLLDKFRPNAFENAIEVSGSQRLKHGNPIWKISVNGPYGSACALRDHCGSQPLVAEFFDNGRGGIKQCLQTRCAARLNRFVSKLR
nr:hypothetical protein [Glaciihabitans tibetensis]